MMMDSYNYDYSSDDDSDWEPITTDDSSTDSSSISSDEDEDLLDEASVCLEKDPCDTFKPTSKPLPPSSRYSCWKNLSCIMAAITALLYTTISSIQFPTADFGDGLDSIYVPGVGFSGFWFTLGRLKSLEDPSRNHFVCFSAGCLGSVAILNDFSVDEMACMAQSAQTAWRSGEIDRYQVVSQFVDGLVYRKFPAREDSLQCLGSLHSSRNASKVPIDHPHLLSKLHILTTTQADHSSVGVKAAMRSPTSLDELREMLIQTAWIPLATGNGLTHDGHSDGGFSLWQHPRCTKSVNLPLDAGLILNSLNVNMGVETAYRLWNEGLAYGL